jgi:ATP-dependent DNA ligase
MTLPRPGQLSLRLEPGVPNPRSGLRPMLDRPLPEPFDSPAHLFEPIWGGIRALVVIGPADAPGLGEVALITEDGSRLDPVPPDLMGLAVRVAARSAVLDGEIVVVDAEGRLDHEGLERRLSGSGGPPLAYLAFDLLDLDGRSLLSLPLERRREALRRVLRPGDELVHVPAIPEEGRALFEAVSVQGLAGVRARQRSSPYLPGVRSRLWRSIAVNPNGPDARAAAAASSPVEPGDRLRLDPELGAAIVLALIAKLPLGLEEEAPSHTPDEGDPPPVGA